jgi:hypothetical protein
VGLASYKVRGVAMKLLVFVVLLIVCWPAALVLLVLYPIVWVVLLPFRVIGITVLGVLDLLRALFALPLRPVRAI